MTLGQVKALSILVSIISPILENTWLNIQIRDAEARYRSIFDNVQDGIALADVETGALADCNQALCRMVGWEKTELVGQAQSILHPPQEEIGGQSLSFQKHWEGDAGLALEDTLLSKSSALIPVEIRTAHITLNGRDYILGIFRDITERKQAEENRGRMEISLRSSHDRLKAVLDSLDALVYVTDMQTYEILFINQYGKDIWGNIEGKTCWQTIQAGQTGPCSFCTNDKIVTRDGVPTGIHIWEFQDSVNNNWYKCLDQAISWIDGRLVRMELAYDITEQKLLEETVLRERSLIDRIMKTSPAGITVVDRKGQIVFANKRTEDIFCLTKNETTQQGYSAFEWHITDFDGNPFPEEQLPFTQVMNTGNPVYGVHSAIELSDGRRIFLLINGAPIFDEQGHVSEVIMSIDDITKFRQAEEKIQQGLKQLEKSLGDTIKAMSRIVETRDPYTAGHQDKVARLAAAIAEKMNLSEEQIRGIQMAGFIHDIGKMYIPGEILSKPGKLSSIEMQLIKTHSQTGYDIIKDIEFPWPVARIILEHHERMDGSGYPNWVLNNDILPEARIIAVADVVDAMASHRPYRPTLGIGAALGEIEKNRGVLYDSGAVDACLMLFREEGFQLEERRF